MKNKMKIALGALVLAVTSALGQVSEPTVSDMAADVSSAVTAGTDIVYTVVPIIFFLIGIGYVVWLARKGRSPR